MEYGLRVVTTDDHYQKIRQIMVHHFFSPPNKACQSLYLSVWANS